MLILCSLYRSKNQVPNEERDLPQCMGSLWTLRTLMSCMTSLCHEVSTFSECLLCTAHCAG